jgi:hypothetical protein
MRALLDRTGKHRQQGCPSASGCAWWLTAGARLRRLGRTPVPAPRRPGIELVDARTRVVHRVSPDALLDGRARGDYEAFCGARFLAASLTDPGRGRCRECAR